MSSYVRWSDIRTDHVERAGGEQAVEAGKQDLLATVVGHRLAEVRRTRGLAQQQVAGRPLCPPIRGSTMDRPHGEVNLLIDPSEYSDVIVTVAHPWGDIETTLEQWIRRGPGPRPFVQIVAAKRGSTGEPVPMDLIPLEYHNSPECRRLQRLGRLPAPWGPPPSGEPEG
jgi:hypothetical protein